MLARNLSRAVAAGALAAAGLACVPAQGGCALHAALDPLRPSPVRAPECEDAIRVAARGPEPLYVIACVDFTRSYPRAIRERALRFLGDAVREHAEVSPSAVYVQVRQIAGNSYAASSELERLALDGLAAPAAWERWSEVADRFPLKKRAIFTEYQRHATAFRAGLDARREALDRFTDSLPRLRRAGATEVRGSDIVGCFAAAEQIFARLEGDKHLVVASDLRRRGPQQGDVVDLGDAVVSVIFRACDTYRECSSQDRVWTRFLSDASSDFRLYRDEELSDPAVFDLRGGS